MNEIQTTQDLSTSLTEMFSEEKMVERKYLTFFTHGSSEYTFNLDDSILKPNTKTRMSGANFEKAYAQQLESILFNNQDKIDEDSLFDLIRLYGFVRDVKRDDDSRRVKLVSGVFKSYLPKITKVLNEYFNKNSRTIHTSYTMFTGTFSKPVN